MQLLNWRIPHLGHLVAIEFRERSYLLAAYKTLEFQMLNVLQFMLVFGERCRWREINQGRYKCGAVGSVRHH